MVCTPVAYGSEEAGVPLTGCWVVAEPLAEELPPCCTGAHPGTPAKYPVAAKKGKCNEMNRQKPLQSWHQGAGARPCCCCCCGGGALGRIEGDMLGAPITGAPPTP